MPGGRKGRADYNEGCRWRNTESMKFGALKQKIREGLYKRDFLSFSCVIMLRREVKVKGEECSFLTARLI